MAESLIELAALYDTQGRNEESEPLLRRALSIIEERLGKSHHLTGITLHNLAAHYTDLNRFTEAEPLAKRALSISEKTLTSAHAETGRAYFTLAGC